MKRMSKEEFFKSVENDPLHSPGCNNRLRLEERCVINKLTHSVVHVALCEDVEMLRCADCMGRWSAVSELWKLPDVLEVVVPNR